jgi:hypothetical protein
MSGAITLLRLYAAMACASTALTAKQASREAKVLLQSV